MFKKETVIICNSQRLRVIDQVEDPFNAKTFKCQTDVELFKSESEGPAPDTNQMCAFGGLDLVSATPCKTSVPLGGLVYHSSF